MKYWRTEDRAFWVGYLIMMVLAIAMWVITFISIQETQRDIERAVERIHDTPEYRRQNTGESEETDFTTGRWRDA